MNKIPMRRFTDKIRLLADEARVNGKKNLAEDLHAVARVHEKARKT